jgi:putative transposase
MTGSTRSYSKDLRIRVVEARLAGLSVSEVCSRYQVDDNSVYRWVARYWETGSVSGKQRGGHKKPKITDIVDNVMFTKNITL